MRSFQTNGGSMFAVYFPQKTGYTDQHFRDAGLADLLDDVPPTFGDFLMAGPDGGRGVFGTWSKDQVTGPDQFEWTKCRGGKFWLGKLAGEKPTPEWFLR